MAAKETPASVPAPAAAAADAPKKKGKLVPLLLIVGMMGAEGVGVFLVTKMFFGAEPAPAGAAEVEGESVHGSEPPEKAEHGAAPAHGEKPEPGGHGEKAAAHPLTGDAEIEITECRPSNRMTGKLVTFRLRVSALVAAAKADKVKQLIEANKARINDRVCIVLRSAEPKDLNEPGLETIKRRLKIELARVLGDEQLIQEILIPEMLQSGSGL